MVGGVWCRVVEGEGVIGEALEGVEVGKRDSWLREVEEGLVICGKGVGEGGG